MIATLLKKNSIILQLHQIFQTVDDAKNVFTLLKNVPCIKNVLCIKNEPSQSKINRLRIITLS